MKKSKRKITRCYFCEQPILRGQPVVRISRDCILHDVCAVRLIEDYEGKEKLEEN